MLSLKVSSRIFIRIRFHVQITFLQIQRQVLRRHGRWTSIRYFGTSLSSKQKVEINETMTASHKWLLVLTGIHE